MKLRIHGNSLRLRLSRTDIEIFQRTGIREQQVRFTSGSHLSYSIEASPVKAIEAEFSHNAIHIRVPSAMAREWAASDQVALSSDSGNHGPSMLIEKDFQCLHHKGKGKEDDADTFPNPEALPANQD